MCPASLSQNEHVVREYQNIETLVDQESMPPLDHELVVVKYYDAKNDLRNDYADTRTDCNPSEHVNTAKEIALYPAVSTQNLSGHCFE